jgi:hypothetical protein
MRFAVPDENEWHILANLSDVELLKKSLSVKFFAAEQSLSSGTKQRCGRR